MALAAGCSLGSGDGGGTTGTSNTCSSTDDAGAFEGTLFTLDASGDLTVNLDAGNGGIDLGAIKIDGGNFGHVYEWPCISTYDCSQARDCSITFQSPNGVSDWSVVSMNFGTGSDCKTSETPADAGPAEDGGGGCCMTCDVSSQPCAGSCLPLFDQCTAGPGCACSAQP
jgi:hypothetical protein